MTNTIQINRSFSATGPGTTLLDGELAYSYVSNSLFIGNSGGAGNAAWTLFGGDTGDINWIGITAGAGLTGTVITGSGNHAQTISIDSGSTLYVAGISSDGGATFGDNIVLGTNNTETNNWIGGGASDDRIEFNTNGNTIYARTLNFDVERSLRHYGDSDTMLFFDTDNIAIHAGGMTGSIHMVAGISADRGATFGGNVHLEGTGNYIQFPDGTTMGTLTSGPVGATGATGSDGAAGSQGIQGVTGNTGPSEEIIGINIDNGSTVLTTGVKGHRVLPYDCEVVEWTVTSIGSVGAIQWDVNWVTYANWPNGLASVAGSDLPNIPASNKKNQDTSVGWTKTTFSMGDILQFEVDSVTTLTNCNLAIKIRRTS